MRTKFDLSNAKNWSSSKSDKSNNLVASSKTTERHSSEWDSVITFSLDNMEEVNAVKSKYVHLSQKYKNKNDCLKVRASGEKISHGKIPFEEGLKSLNGFYQMLKLAARSSVSCKKKNEIIKDYLVNVDMLAPQAGSFIYSAEVSLDKCLEKDYFIEDISIHRYINMRFALMLSNTSRFIANNHEPNMALLFKNHIDAKFCNYFLELFSDSTDNLEFFFDWANSEKAVMELPQYVIFDRESRNRVFYYKKLLKNSKTKPYTDLPAIIEQYAWKKSDKQGTVVLRLMFGDKEHTCSISVDEIMYEKLKALKHQKQVAITADIIEKTGSKNSVEILKLHSLTIDKGATVCFNPET
ncbi:hypothetical protein [Vibrio cholerae]|uniref:hypothetical protein n=1 Tax=Vibrio cholerae TaxID=666 RepID=UPI003017F354